ncbi:MAG: TonB-dependent receptor [Candidatus Methylomirabilales bacterium]
MTGCVRPSGFAPPLALWLALALAPAWAAEGPPVEEHRLEEVVFTATRLPDLLEELRRVPGQVYVITAEEIERRHAPTVQEALRQTPGIVFYNLTGNPYQPTLDLRGFNAQPNPSISVFVDGIRVNEPDTNAVNFDLIPIQDVERIEVLPGAAAIFGRNSLGGAINIITKRGAKTPRTTLEAAAGSFSRSRLSAGTSGPLKQFDYYLGLSLDRESGFRDYSDSRVSRATARLGYRPSDATDVSLSTSYVNDRLEQPGSLSLAELAQDRTQASRISLHTNELASATLQGRQGLGAGFSLAGSAGFRQTSREGFDFPNSFRQITDTNTTTGTLQLSHELRFGRRVNRLSLGAELQHSGVQASTSFGDRRLVDDDALGFFVQDTIDVTSQVALTAAVRYDRTKIRLQDLVTPANDGSKQYSRATPRAGLTYAPLASLTLYANYGEGFRVPTTDELFAFGGFFGSSNPDLRPVKSRTYEVGVRARPIAWVETTASLFLTDVEDEIVFIPNPAVCAFCGQNQNSPKSRRQGAEVGAKLRPVPWMDLGLNYTYTDARFRSASNTIEKGDRVPLVPEHRANGTITVRPLAGLELGVNAQYVGRQVLLNDEANTATFRLQDYYVLNAGASYTWRQFRWWVQGHNLTDHEYAAYGALSAAGQPFVMPAPGISVLGGVTVAFEGYY